MKELEVTLLVRNNRIKQRRMEHGLTQQELAKRCGLSPHLICHYECMKISPMDKRTGTWCDSAVKIANYFDVDPIELFPDIIHQITKSRATRRLNAQEASMLIASTQAQQLVDENTIIDEVEKKRTISEILDLLEHIPENEKVVLIRRYGLLGDRPETLNEIATSMQRSKERVRQMEAEAIIRLSRWYRRKLLASIELPPGEIDQSNPPRNCLRCDKPIPREKGYAKPTLCYDCLQKESEGLDEEKERRELEVGSEMISDEEWEEWKKRNSSWYDDAFEKAMEKRVGRKYWLGKKIRTRAGGQGGAAHPDPDPSSSSPSSED